MLQMINEFCALWKCKYFGEKGQDLIEYALLLAIVVGIGFLIYQQTSLQDNINSIFSNASNLTASAAAKGTQKAATST